MKRFLIIALLMPFALCLQAMDVEPSYAIMGNDTTCQIFIYSPAPREGLHLAYLGDDGQWHHVGQLCGSDYAQWGSEKRMYHPYVAHAEDGTWRLAFSVNDHAPCLAVAYSEDLVTWRPQDYPRMSSKGCLQPVIFPLDDMTADIYYKTPSGEKRYVQATADFRHFTEDPSPSTIDDVVWQRDSAEVAGKPVEGNIFDVPLVHLNYICDYFEALRRDGELNRESMRDDVERFKSLPDRLQATLSIDAGNEKPISEHLIGVFFEDISYAADGGLYAELIQNRDFEYSPRDRREWQPLTAWTAEGRVEVSTDRPLSANNPHYAVLREGTLSNLGWDGITLKQGADYDCSLYVRKSDSQKQQRLRVQLVSGDVVLAKADLKVKASGWQRLKVTFRPKADATDARLQIVNLSKGAALHVDMVSLFPQDTYKGHGMRRDLAETIADLKPKFVRFPGGCMSHGEGLGNIYHWNHTVGPWQDRKPDMNIWHYHQTRGLGFYEYFQFCEDIGAEPLPVLAAGVPCQNSAPNSDGYGGQQGGIPMEEMKAYCEELCQLIEWANGDPATSKWARMRAEAGHPAPFHLKYIGIGNEDIISTTFEERCEMICKYIKERYPDIIICGTVGPFHYPSADYIEGWKFAKAHHDVIDMVDEHYYESTGWFMNHLDYYDDYDRTAPKVYVGEYASRSRTHESALAEALFLCHVERNADIIEMTSYAPLLAKEGHHNWNPDLIYFNNTSVELTPSYETQHLFGNFSGNRYVASRLEIEGGWTESVPETAHRIAASMVRDSKTGKTYLKLVNALPVSVSMDIVGKTLPEALQVEGFSGQPGDKHVERLSGQISAAFAPLQRDGNRLTLQPYSVFVIAM